MREVMLAGHTSGDEEGSDLTPADLRAAGLGPGRQRPSYMRVTQQLRDSEEAAVEESMEAIVMAPAVSLVVASALVTTVGVCAQAACPEPGERGQHCGGRRERPVEWLEQAGRLSPKGSASPLGA